MELIKLENLPVIIENDNFYARKVLENADVKVMNISVKPGGKVPEHSVPVHVFFYVVGGKGSIQIGDEVREVTAGDIIVCPADTEMALFADKDSELVVLNVKTPSYNPV